MDSSPLVTIYDKVHVSRVQWYNSPSEDSASIVQSKGGGNRGARGAMAPLNIFLEGPGPSKIISLLN